jgi:hypothetical protein
MRARTKLRAILESRATLPRPTNPTLRVVAGGAPAAATRPRQRPSQRHQVVGKPAAAVAVR